jgi:hypothetical protein
MQSRRRGCGEKSSTLETADLAGTYGPRLTPIKRPILKLSVSGKPIAQPTAFTAKGSSQLELWYVSDRGYR